MLQLRHRDQDMHRVLNVALQPWPTLAGLNALTEFGVKHVVLDSYFRADYFCRYHHEDHEYRHKLGKTAVDRAAREGSGTIAPIVNMDKFFYEKKQPRTTADLNYRLVTGSSSSLSLGQHWRHCRRAQKASVLRSRFSLFLEVRQVTLRDGDHSDFGLAFGVYRQ